jgi:tetratricopeptide (TPR) repeat protein
MRGKSALRNREEFVKSRSLLVAGLLAGLAASAQAQLARTPPGQINPNAPKVLVTHFWFDAGDSALALLVADGLRDRMRLTHGMQYNTLTRQIINENLIQSGFQPDAPLEQTVLRTLARFLNTRYVVEARLTRREDSIYVTARFYESIGQVPQSANVVVGTTRQRIGTSTGAEVANRLMEASRSFQDVTRCRTELEAGNLQRARQRASDALRGDPNSTGAYLCLASILEREEAPVDTVLGVLRTAFGKDTLNTIVMRRMAQKYELVGDTNNLVQMLRRILTIDRRDNELRIGTARLFVTLARYDDAIAVIDQGLETNPASLELLQARSVALGAARRFAEAATTLQQVGEIDSSSIDSAFVFRITNYFREAGDSAGWYRWSQAGTRRFPQQANYWFDVANLAMAQADTNTSVAAGFGYLRLRPDDGRGHLLVARPLLARGQTDTALAHARLAGADSALRPFAGLLYLTAGINAARDTAWALVEERLELAAGWIPVQQMRTQHVLASYFAGVAKFQIGMRADNEAQNARSCDAALLSLRKMGEAEPLIIAGAAQDRQQANQLLQAIGTFRQRAEQFMRQYRCPPPPSS